MSANLTTLDETIKVKYGPAYVNQINNMTVLLNRIEQKKRDFKGKNYTQPKGLSYGGGIGARSGASPTLPTAGNTIQGEIVANAKKLYARVDIDREAIVAGKKSEQVFIESTQHEFRSKARRFSLDLARQIYGTGNGSLGRLNADPGTATSFVVTAATWNENYFMEGDRIDFYADNGSGDVDTATKRTGGAYVISSIAPATRTITLSGAINAAVQTGDHVVIEGNAGNEITGLSKHVDAQTGTVQNIDKSTYFRARGLYKDASSAAVSIDLMNEVSELSVNRSVSPFNMIVCNPYQWRQISQLLENAKIYYAKDSDKGKFGFEALEYCSPVGVVPVYADRFCPKEKMYFLNPDSFNMILREDWGWFDDDGTVLLRQATTDAYEARYGGYGELICTEDNSNGVLDNLATS